MSFEEDFITKYQSVFGPKRLNWDTAPEGWDASQMDAPFAVAQIVGGKTKSYVDDKEQPKFLNARVQVDVWGRSRIEVSNKIREFAGVVMASNEAEFYAHIASEPASDWNGVLKLRGMRQDFSFWFPNPLFVP